MSSNKCAVHNQRLTFNHLKIHVHYIVLLVEDKSTVLNDSFYLSIIAWSVDVQNLNYRVVLVSERKMLIQTKETHLPSGVSWFF